MYVLLPGSESDTHILYKEEKYNFIVHACVLYKERVTLQYGHVYLFGLHLFLIKCVFIKLRHGKESSF